MCSGLMNVIDSCGSLLFRSFSASSLRSQRTRPLLEAYEFTLNEGNTIIRKLSLFCSLLILEAWKGTATATQSYTYYHDHIIIYVRLTASHFATLKAARAFMCGNCHILLVTTVDDQSNAQNSVIYNPVAEQYDYGCLSQHSYSLLYDSCSAQPLHFRYLHLNRKRAWICRWKWNSFQRHQARVEMSGCNSWVFALHRPNARAELVLDLSLILQLYATYNFKSDSISYQ
jgi:hypothetical protein